MTELERRVLQALTRGPADAGTVERHAGAGGAARLPELERRGLVVRALLAGPPTWRITEAGAELAGEYQPTLFQLET